MADIDMLDEIKARLAAATPGPLRLWSDVRPDDFAMYRCADGSLHPFGSIFEHHDGLCQAALLVQRRGTKGWVPCRRVRAEGSHLCYQHGGQTTGRTSKATRLRGDLAYLVGEVERLRLVLAQVLGSKETDLGVFASDVCRIAREALAKKGGDAQ